MEILKQNKVITSFTIIIIISLLCEIFIFNYSAIISRNYQPIEYPIKKVKVYGQSTKLSNSVTVNGEAIVEVKHFNKPIKNLSLYITGGKSYKTGYVDIKDSLQFYNYYSAAVFHFVPSNNKYVYVKVNPYGAVNSIRFFFKGNDKKFFFLKKITFNDVIPFDFSVLRLSFFIFFGSWIFLIFHYKHVVYNESIKIQKFTYFAVAFLCIVFATFCHNIFFSDEEKECIKLQDVTSNVYKVDYYQNMFLALLEGKFSIETDTTFGLEKLKNPYDASERDKRLKYIRYPFDLAYYKGKFYLYFGLAPIITSYFPFYILSGYLPASSTVSLMLSIYAILAIFAATKELAKKFVPLCSYVVLLSCAFTATFACGVYFFLSSPPYYNIDKISMIAFSAATIYFIFKAFNGGSQKQQAIFLFLAGITLVLSVMSRPLSLFIILALISPLFISKIWHIINNRREKFFKIRRLANLLIPFILPLTCGGLFVMYYNYVRFDSIFEFGQSYQLTVYDHTHLQFVASDFFKSIVLYFFQAPTIHTIFPYIFSTFDSELRTGKVLYNVNSMGMLFIPINLALFFITTFRRNRLMLKTAISVFCVSLLVTYLDFTSGGLILRYIFDVSWPLSFIAILIILKLTAPSTYEQRLFLPVATIMCTLTIVVTMALCFSHLDARRLAIYVPENLLYITNLFSLS